MTHAIVKAAVPEMMAPFVRKHQTALFIVAGQTKPYQERVIRLLESVNGPGMCVDIITVHTDDDNALVFQKWADDVKKMTFEKFYQSKFHPRTFDSFAVECGYTASLVMWDPSFSEPV